MAASSSPRPTIPAKRVEEKDIPLWFEVEYEDICRSSERTKFPNHCQQFHPKKEKVVKVRYFTQEQEAERKRREGKSEAKEEEEVGTEREEKRLYSSFFDEPCDDEYQIVEEPDGSYTEYVVPSLTYARVPIDSLIRYYNNQRLRCVDIKDLLSLSEKKDPYTRTRFTDKQIQIINNWNSLFKPTRKAHLDNLRDLERLRAEKLSAILNVDVFLNLSPDERIKAMDDILFYLSGNTTEFRKYQLAWANRLKELTLQEVKRKTGDELANLNAHYFRSLLDINRKEPEPEIEVMMYDFIASYENLETLFKLLYTINRLYPERTSYIVEEIRNILSSGVIPLISSMVNRSGVAKAAEIVFYMIQIGRSMYPIISLILPFLGRVQITEILDQVLKNTESTVAKKKFTDLIYNLIIPAFSKESPGKRSDLRRILDDWFQRTFPAAEGESKKSGGATAAEAPVLVGRKGFESDLPSVPVAEMTSID